ncbi:hypothetical protein [Synechococcus sp. MIT S9504]|uniref:hypothetical protein n=1 Tax=Synechococcus sp. MIT S9504 TaxID=1801628 RepID=UPI0007BBB8F0|nr:hypothetical protein [Synechococcus sp. MIT S9504]KZR86849.1 hypothetical protein MITS9504_00935 [Synechococcus sp. MIT S9504]
MLQGDEAKLPRPLAKSSFGVRVEDWPAVLQQQAGELGGGRHRVGQRAAEGVSEQVDPRLETMNLLLSQQLTNEQNHHISNKSLLHGLGGDHEVPSEKIGRP